MLSGWSMNELMAYSYYQMRWVVSLLVPKVVFVIWDIDIFLPVYYRFRRMNGRFDSSEEYREAVNPPSSHEVYQQVKGLEVIFEKHSKGTVSCGEAMNYKNK